MRELALFAGAGGGLLGGRLLGWRTVCAVELDAYCRSVLLARQRDGILSRFPIWDDVVTFDGRPWRGHVDVVSGGFPCQDISSAGTRSGLAGSKSGLWFEFARIIDEVKPGWVFIENSPHLRTRGLGRCLKDLAGMGFDAEWGILGAEDAGAPHKRKRLWIVATNPDNARQRGQPVDVEVASSPAPSGSLGVLAEQSTAASPDSSALRLESGRRSRSGRQETALVGGADWWPVDSIQGVDDGVAYRMERVRATGNGQVPSVARLAWQVLTERLKGTST